MPLTMGAPDQTKATEIRRIKTDNGSVVCRLSTTNGSGRPVVFVPGWGAEFETFEGLHESLSEDVMFRLFETREKRSSELTRDASFSMRQFARDLSAVISALGLAGEEYVLAGTCFGAAVCIEALARRLVHPTVTLLFDPMPRMWVPAWVLGLVGPTLPVSFIRTVRPFVRSMLLHGMNEQKQRERSRRIIDGADLWKWKRGSYALRDWSAYDATDRIHAPVHVYNGSSDRFHSASQYPAVAAAIPGAYFLGFEFGESDRERFMGEVINEYASAVSDEIPLSLENRAIRINKPDSDVVTYHRGSETATALVSEEGT
jgi:pimeloyl-ACP methyl ester carboxylesterase